MATIENVTVALMLLALIAYVLLGGADFGGGVWDLLASGARKERQRELISRAIGPVWEANHVWLIALVVLAFTGFPRAFAAAMTALHVPLTLMLIGVVLRGCAFTFRAYDRPGAAARRWGMIFSISSVITPLLLGVSLGALASGDLRWSDEGVYASGFFAPWLLRAFPWSVGAFALALFAFLAAVYLCVEADDAELRDDFRRRALGAGVAVGVAAGATWALAIDGAALLSGRLADSAWTWPLQIATGLCAAGALVQLWRRRYASARALAVAQVALIVAGFGAAMHPYLVVPGFTIENSAAPAPTHLILVASFAAGALILIPSLIYLFRVFKGDRAFALLDE